MATPLKPHWVRPSHSDIQEVIINEADFTSKSLSKVSLPPWGEFARLRFPPCTLASEPTYATVQFGRDLHLNLNSDLLYINHSCEPSLIFDMTRLVVTAGPKGLQPGDELTFFYPSTEWSMAQPFDCLCGKEACRGRISGAGDMTDDQLRGMLLNKHIYELLDKRKAPAASENGAGPEDGVSFDQGRLERLPEELQKAVCRALKAIHPLQPEPAKQVNEMVSANGSYPEVKSHAGQEATPCAVNGSLRRGPTSGELSGEMGGDTSIY